MVKTFKEYVSGLSLGGYRLGNLDSFRPIASLGDRPPKGQGNRDSRGVGLVANYSGQAPGTMRPFLTAAKKIQDKNKKDKAKIQEIYTGYKGLHVGDKVRIKGEKAMGVGEIFAIVKPYGARKEPEYEIIIFCFFKISRNSTGFESFFLFENVDMTLIFFCNIPP